MTHSGKVAPGLLALALAALLCTAGCSEMRHITASLGSSSKPYQEFLEDPVTLTTIKTIAVFPFEDKSPQEGFDADSFANKLANQLAAHGKVRVLYPRDILARVEKENIEARRHNSRVREKVALGLMSPDEAAQLGDDGENATRAYYDPVRNVDEAIRLARRAKADAIFVGEVSDHDPYTRPRMSLTMRLIATGSTETAAQAIAELTQWGIPRSGSGTSGGGTIYVRQESFDSSVGSVGMEVSKYGRTHLIDNHPLDTAVYTYSMDHYYDVVASQLAGAYAEARKKAVKEAEERAKAKAKQDKDDQKKAVARLLALMERDSRIPDYETDRHGENYFDQAFADKNKVLSMNGGDRRIQSWRPEGRASRPADIYERQARDMMIPDNERGRGLEGYSAMVDSSFPDADAMMEMNMGDNRDRSWRPDHYFRANPKKAAPLYAPEEFRGYGNDY